MNSINVTNLLNYLRNQRNTLLTYSAGLVGVGLIVLAFIPIFTDRSVSTASLAYATQYKPDSSIELNESKVIQQGVNGSTLITHESKMSLFDKVFSRNPRAGVKTTSAVTSKPTIEIVMNGTTKYQYMYCSNGSSRMYTDDQFKNPYVGFTHKSQDYCAKNNAGVMTKLANAPPASAPQAVAKPAPYTPYVPSNCIKTTIPYSTSYQQVSYLNIGQSQSIGGYDGYKVTCSTSSTGFKLQDYSSQPTNKITYQGTAANSSGNTVYSSSSARQKCIDDYNSAKAQISMAGASSSSAMETLQQLYAQCLARAG